MVGWAYRGVYGRGIGKLFNVDGEYSIFLGLDCGIIVMFLLCSFTTWGVFTFYVG